MGARKDTIFLKGLASGSLTMLLEVYGQHILDLVFFFSFFALGVAMRAGDGLVRTGKWM